MQIYLCQKGPHCPAEESWEPGEAATSVSFVTYICFDGDDAGQTGCSFECAASEGEDSADVYQSSEVRKRIETA